MKKKIYIADDEASIRMLIVSFLEKEDFEAIGFSDGSSLLDVFSNDPADLVILDAMMPGMDGLNVCNTIRSISNVPIMIVSARDTELDRIMGLAAGGDDYMVKPFSSAELLVRVKALFRRAQMSSIPQPDLQPLSYGDIKIDVQRRIVMQTDTPFAVTPTEFGFLVHMINNQERAVSKKELLHELWQLDFEADTRVADDLVKRLRRKLISKKSTLHIETVWGFGFRLERTD